MLGITHHVFIAGLGLGLVASEPEPEVPLQRPDAPAAPSGPTEPEPEPEPEPTPDEPAPPPTAAVRAQEHFQAGEWDQAIEALMEAYAADPNPAYLYARAQAERMRGNCKAAIALYRRFLESDPSETQRADTERHIRLCEEILFNEQVEQQPEPTPEPSPEPEDQQPPDPDDDVAAGPRPWYRDPVGMTLLVSGTGALAAGATLWGLGDRDRRRAPESSTEGGYEDQLARGRQRVYIGAPVAAVGAALAIAGTIRLVRISKRARLAAAPWWNPWASGASVRVRF